MSRVECSAFARGAGTFELNQPAGCMPISRSLSPEQQAFAKAFRAMQLESTLFGVLVVQIKLLDPPTVRVAFFGVLEVKMESRVTHRIRHVTTGNYRGTT